MFEVGDRVRLVTPSPLFTGALKKGSVYVVEGMKGECVKLVDFYGAANKCRFILAKPTNEQRIAKRMEELNDVH